jgi:pyruvate dehydrogenase E2 component (dihydrolipoamide acetyltransferase)
MPPPLSSWRIMDKPWVEGGALAVRNGTKLTLTFDYRACVGGTGAGVLGSVADAIENSGSVLKDL